MLVFQDPALFRYNTQIAALIGLIVTAAAIVLADRLMVAIGVVAAAMVAIVAIAWVVMPELVNQVVTDLNRFRPDATRMAVLEARPLFLYTGNWKWSQPWIFFRSGFYVGLVAVAALAVATWRSRRVDHLLILCFTVANYLATFGQNRFGYYLVPSTAVVIAWLAVQILDWGGVPHADNPAPKIKRPLPFQREIAVILVAGIVVAPNLVPAALTTTRGGGMPGYWFDAMQWLRTNTPEPFASPGYYHARYGATNPPAGFSVMNWWDQGYWILQTGRRVPVTNPTQSGATTAGGVSDRDRRIRSARTARRRSRPLRDRRLGAAVSRRRRWVAGRPLSEPRRLGRHSDVALLLVVFLAAHRGRSVAAHVAVSRGLLPDDGVSIDGAGRRGSRGRRTTPMSSTSSSARTSTAARFAKSSIAGSTRTPKRQSAAASQRGAGFEAVGLTPWQPAFPVPAIAGLKVASEFRDPSQKANESPMVRIFEVTPP